MKIENKLAVVIIAILTFALQQNLQAQVRVHESGQISLQNYDGDWYQGIQVYPSGTTHFNTTYTHGWHWVTIASPKHPKGKCWIVNYPDMDDSPEEQKDDHRFFVTGEGYVHKRGSLRLADINLQTSIESISTAGAILDGITGTYYIPIDESNDDSKIENRKVGVSAQEVEKVLPEAVSRDDRDLMYVDYEALTTVLIEAYKEQKSEIELLRKTLEENGLLKPEK